MKQFDVIVLGAGIVGVSTALHLQLLGRKVCLVDKKQPGRGTSFGNAGLIERSSVIPYSFPRNFRRILGYALNNQTDVRFDWSYLPKIAPWIFQFWQQSAAKNLQKSTDALLPLIENSVIEHDFLAKLARAEGFIEPKGWLEVYHHHDEFEHAKKEAASLSSYRLQYDVLDKQRLIQRVPFVSEKMTGGIHWLDPKTVNDPGGLTAAYADYFQQQGGTFVLMDAFAATATKNGWSITDDAQHVEASQMVVALGADSARFLKTLGYPRIPFAIKRGYHMHYRQIDSNTPLQHSLCDPKSGFVLAPMRQGIRLTTGIEFAADNAPARWTQLDRAEKIARTIFPFGERLETVPWLGYRPCLSDMRPIISAAPKHEGLWLNFGHAHHGLTLGPVSGKLLSQMMTGQATLTSPDAFSLKRFF